MQRCPQCNASCDNTVITCKCGYNFNAGLVTSYAPFSGGPGLQNASRKIGGWLVLVAIGLILAPLGIVKNIIGSLITFGFLSSQLHQMERLYPGVIQSSHPDFKSVFIVSIVLQLALLVFCIRVAVLFFAKKKIVPKLMIILILTNILISLVIVIWTGNIFDKVNDSLAASIMLGLIGALIWIPYFLISKRVKETFIFP